MMINNLTNLYAKVIWRREMNYDCHYNNLIERARNRNIFKYTEKHEIIPSCIGGTNEIGNVVYLTPKEHYVAHQLLVKIYPLLTYVGG